MKRRLERNKVLYQMKPPSLRDLERLTGGKNFVLLFDERLSSYPVFSKWASVFEKRLALRSGENLKSIDELPGHVRNILPLLSGFSPQETVVVAVGGGSVGDFAGFVASILKRGVGYVNLPTTWLAAVDSAHGGKNGLNVSGLKNQVGTFYEPKAVICVKKFLELQPVENVRSAYGEVLKISLLMGRDLMRQIMRAKRFDGAGLWSFLPKVVEAKYNIVKKDPKEQSGYRHLLNFGHTLGHAYEMDRLLPHGVAVQLGLEFATEWSHKLRLLGARDYEVLKILFAKNKLNPLQPLPVERLYMLLRQDKKAKGGDLVRFVFIKRPGSPVIKEVPLDDVVRAARELGWAQ